MVMKFLKKAAQDFAKGFNESNERVKEAREDLEKRYFELSDEKLAKIWKTTGTDESRAAMQILKERYPDKEILYQVIGQYVRLN